MRNQVIGLVSANYFINCSSTLLHTNHLCCASIAIILRCRLWSTEVHHWQVGTPKNVITLHLVVPSLLLQKRIGPRETSTTIRNTTTTCIWLSHIGIGVTCDNAAKLWLVHWRLNHAVIDITIYSGYVIFIIIVFLKRVRILLDNGWVLFCLFTNRVVELVILRLIFLYCHAFSL